MRTFLLLHRPRLICENVVELEKVQNKCTKISLSPCKSQKLRPAPSLLPGFWTLPNTSEAFTRFHKKFLYFCTLVQKYVIGRPNLPRGYKNHTTCFRVHWKPCARLILLLRRFNKQSCNTTCRPLPFRTHEITKKVEGEMGGEAKFAEPKSGCCMA